MRRKGKQTDLASALMSLERRFSRTSQGRYLQVRVARAWESTAGPTVSEHTTGVFLRNGELNVQVDSSVWAAELAALAGPYTEALNTELGKETVRTIRFTVSRRVAQSRREKTAQQEIAEFYRSDPSRSLPLTATERAQVEASASVIDDEELREAAIKATIASMEWRKGQNRPKSSQKS